MLIFDEIQSVPEALLDAVLSLFDGPDGRLLHVPSTAAAAASALLPERITEAASALLPERLTQQLVGPSAVNTSRCIVIVTSDLGSTRLSPDMDREEAKGSRSLSL